MAYMFLQTCDCNHMFADMYLHTSDCIQVVADMCLQHHKKVAQNETSTEESVWMTCTEYNYLKRCMTHLLTD